MSTADDSLYNELLPDYLFIHKDKLRYKVQINFLHESIFTLDEADQPMLLD